jgi:replicative DNA helicase
MEKINKKHNKIKIKKYLPHNFLVEKSILSSLLTNSETIELILHHLTIEIFYFKNHQELYRAIIFLHQKKIQIDILTLTSFLQDNGLLEKIGGLKILIDLINQIPNILYLEEYIRLLQDKFLRRRLIKLGYQIINSSYVTNVPLENILNDLEKNLNNITNPRNKYTIFTSAELLTKVFFELKQKSLKNKLSGLQSGFKSLDLLTSGFQKSDLIIIAGRPGMGKTGLCLNLMTSIVKTYKLPVIFFSLEMGKEQLMYRLLSTETEISSTNLKTGNINKEEWIKLSLAIKKFSLLPIFIDDTTNISIQTIRIQLKKILFEETKIGLVIIDYLQLMQNSKSKIENRVQELSQITRSLKSIAKEFNIPLIALSQLSRTVETRINKRPQLSDLRESGSIEQDADLVLMLFRENYYNSKQEQEELAELIIAKHRNGPSGTIELKFNPKFIKFSDYDY